MQKSIIIYNTNGNKYALYQIKNIPTATKKEVQAKGEKWQYLENDFLISPLCFNSLSETIEMIELKQNKELVQQLNNIEDIENMNDFIVYYQDCQNKAREKANNFVKSIGL